jgi:subtilisin family serine protease
MGIRRYRLPSRLTVLLLATFACAVCLALPSAAPASAGPSRNTLLVKPRPGAGAGAFDRALARFGVRQVGRVPGLGVRIVRVAPAERGAALHGLRGAGPVAYAEPDGLTPPAEAVPNDALWVNQWSQPKTRTDRAWSRTPGSPVVKVAILDSGVDPSQPDLAGNLLPGWDFYNGDSDPSDDYGHGTQVAGVAAGRSGDGIGIAGFCGRCSILPVKIAGSDGYATWSAMASGIAWATDRGARVVNVSFAGTSGSKTVADAIAYAHEHGVVVTVSAGNYGSSSPTYPAAYPGALAVAATTREDGLESYSDYGSWVQLAAPGCNYGTGRTSSSSLFGNFCGTSSAAPAAAGIAALAFSYDPSATGAQVEAALESGAAPVGGFVRYGRVDAWGALAALGASDPAATAPLGEGAPIVVGPATGPLSEAPQPGELLWTSGGGWSGAPPIGLAFQWERCDSAGAGCAPISGAVWRTYTPSESDAGHTLRTVVTATDPLGSSSAVSAPTAVVGGSVATPPPEEPSTSPSEETPPPEEHSSPEPVVATTVFSGSINRRHPSKSFDLAVGEGEADATLTFSNASSLTVTLLAPDGTTVATVSGASGVRLVSDLAPGTYAYEVSGAVKKGSASFSLEVSYFGP